MGIERDDSDVPERDDAGAPPALVLLGLLAVRGEGGRERGREGQRERGTEREGQREREREREPR